MIKYYLFVILTVLLIAGCASSNIDDAGKDGKSIEKAIIINASSERSGIRLINKWLGDNYPGYSINSQATTHKDRKVYDIMDISTSEGKQLTLYFEITSFYGKW